MTQVKAARPTAAPCGVMFRSLLSLSIACLIAGAGSSAAAAAVSPDRGYLLVQRYCAGCHSVRRTGASPNPASPPFRDLSTRYKIDDLGEALAEGILTGHPAMPEFRFPPADIAAILAYIRSIQTLQSTSAERPVEGPPPIR